MSRLKSILSTVFVFITLGGGIACSSSSDNSASSQAPPLCKSSGKNAFATYGTAAFISVTQAIFTNIGAEVTAHGVANVGGAVTKVGSGNPPSTADDAATFMGKLAAFLVFTYGGPTSIAYSDGKTYVGNNQDMVAAHTGLNITSAQYDYFLANIILPALTSSGVSTDDVSSCFAPTLTDATFKASIVGR